MSYGVFTAAGRGSHQSNAGHWSRPSAANDSQLEWIAMNETALVCLRLYGSHGCGVRRGFFKCVVAASYYGDIPTGGAR